MGTRSSSQRSPRQSSGLSRSPRNVPSERRTAEVSRRGSAAGRGRPRRASRRRASRGAPRRSAPMSVRIFSRLGRDSASRPSARPTSGSFADEAEHAERGRHVAGHAERGADEHEPPDAPGLVEREDGAHEAAHRTAREVDRVELEAVHDVAHEGRRNGREIRRLVVEPIRQPVAGRSTASTRCRPASAARTGAQRAALSNAPWTSTSGGPSPSSSTRVSPCDHRRRRVRVPGAIRSSTASCAASILRSSPLVPRTAVGVVTVRPRPGLPHLRRAGSP